ncbi:nucleoside triphosphate pyrophosphohydrolase family protein [Anaerolineales bacterium HSG6]|nr:nucleoside triphosphate pyrophosphohydrolase family protein [Anaerolineales bacterium HSG6]
MTITFKEYQELAARTAGAGNHDQQLRLAIAGLGLTGEAGEVAEKIKKHVGHGHPLDRENLLKELGDVLWYVAELCTVSELNMAEVAQHNVDKLKRRYPEGFSQSASLNRVEE